MKLLKGADAAKMLTERAKTIAESLETPPKLLIVRFGADGSDLAYENNAKKRMEKCGILCESLVFPTDVEPALFFERFLAVNEDDSVHGPTSGTNASRRNNRTSLSEGKGLLKQD